MTDQEQNNRFDRIDQRFAEVDQRFEEVIELVRGVETTLLKEFRKWAITFESRFRANEILVGGFNERLIALEERVGEIERGSNTGSA